MIQSTNDSMNQFTIPLMDEVKTIRLTEAVKAAG